MLVRLPKKMLITSCYLLSVFNNNSETNLFFASPIAFLIALPLA